VAEIRSNQVSASLSTAGRRAEFSVKRDSHASLDLYVGSRLSDTTRNEFRFVIA
jgi:hypothetical protein